MQRVIKFRVWDEALKQMECSFWQIHVQYVNGAMFPTKGFQLMQFTGLKDSKGKDIYEGDIIHWGLPSTSKYTSDGDKAIVEWNEKRAGFIMKRYYQVGANHHPHLTIYSNTKVIGDIHSTPELLK